MISSALDSIRAASARWVTGSDAVLMLFAWTIQFIASLINSIVLARYLGPTDLGFFTYAIAMVAMMTAVVGGAINGMIVRELSHHPSNRAAILGSALCLKLAAAFAVCGIGLPITWWAMPHEMALQLIFIMSGSVFFEWILLSELCFQADRKFVKVAQLRMVKALGGMLARLSLALAGASLIWFSSAVYLDLFIALLVISVITKASYSDWLRQASFPLFLRMAKEALPLMMAALSLAAYSRVVQLMVLHLAGPSELGVFGLVARIAEMVAVLPSIIVAVVVPRLISQAKSDADLEKILYSFMFWLGAAFAAFLWFVGPMLIRILYGDAYLEACDLIGPYGITLITAFLMLASNTVLTIVRAPGVILMRTAIGALLSVGLAYVFLPYYGLLGAINAILISSVIALLLPFKIPDRPNFLHNLLFAADPRLIARWTLLLK